MRVKNHQKKWQTILQLEDVILFTKCRSIVHKR